MCIATSGYPIRVPREREPGSAMRRVVFACEVGVSFILPPSAPGPRAR